MQTHEILLRPSAILAFFRSAPIILLANIFLLLAWWLSTYFIWFSLACSLVAWYRSVA